VRIGIASLDQRPLKIKHLHDDVRKSAPEELFDAGNCLREAIGASQTIDRNAFVRPWWLVGMSGGDQGEKRIRCLAARIPGNVTFVAGFHIGVFHGEPAWLPRSEFRLQAAMREDR